MIGLCEDFSGLLERLAFNVATWLHAPEWMIQRYPVPKLLQRTEWINEERWEDMIISGLAVEFGINRALSGKEPARIPHYRDRGQQHKVLPAWMRKFEEANPERALSSKGFDADG